MAGIPGAHPTSGVFSGMAAAFSQQPSPMASPPTAITPMMGMSSQGAPTGNTPNAKRPMDRVAIDVALTGSRLMTRDGRISNSKWHWTLAQSYMHVESTMYLDTEWVSHQAVEEAKNF